MANGKIENLIKYVDKAYSNCSFNSNCECNLGPNTNFFPSDVKEILAIIVTTTSTGGKTVRVETNPGIGANIWLCNDHANTTISTVNLRGFYRT